MRSVLRYGFACLRTGSVRLLAAALLIVTMAFSQMSSISGTVKDQSGAIVSSAMIILTENAGTTKKSKLADAAGVYEFTEVPPGHYTLEVQAPGFTTVSKVLTATNAPLKLDIGLEISHETTQVAVEGRIDPYNVVPSMPTQSIFGIRSAAGRYSPLHLGRRFRNHAALQREDRQRYRGGVHRVVHRQLLRHPGQRVLARRYRRQLLPRLPPRGKPRQLSDARRRPPITSKWSKARLLPSTAADASAAS